MSMALPPAARWPAHLRQIACEAFERDDGLIELEGLLTDTKPTPVRLAVDRDGLIREAQAYSEVSPYPECPGIEGAYGRLVGLRIGPGFAREVKRLFRGTAGCTHMTELIPPMATILFQVLWADSDFRPVAGSVVGGRSPVGACHGLRLDGEVTRIYFTEGGPDGD